LLDVQESRYKEAVLEVFDTQNNQKYKKHKLNDLGISSTDIINGSHFAFNIDHQNVRYKNVNEHLYLPICHSRIAAGKATIYLNRFLTESVSAIGKNYNPNIASETLTKGFEEILKVRTHNFAVQSWVTPDYVEDALFFDKSQYLASAICKAVEFT